MDNLRRAGVLAVPVEPSLLSAMSGSRVVPIATVPGMGKRLWSRAVRQLVGVPGFVVMSTVLCPRIRARSRQAQAEESHG